MQIKFVEFSKRSDFLIVCFWEILNYWRQNDTECSDSANEIQLLTKWLVLVQNKHFVSQEP